MSHNTNNMPSGMCTQQRLKSACASAQPDLSLCCPQENILHPWLSKMRLITKADLYNFDLLKPHFYIVKRGFTGVNMIFFLFLLKNIDCGYSLESLWQRGSNEYTCFEQKYEKYQNFSLNTFSCWWRNFHHIWIDMFSYCIRWAHMSKGMFSHVASHIYSFLVSR